MSYFAIIFLTVNVVLLQVLPRRWAPLPLLLGACYMTLGEKIEIGPFSFTMVRMLIAAGFVRLIIRNERLAGKANALDWLMAVWAAWALMSSFFYDDLSGALIFRLGLVYNICGIYFLMRVFCRSLEDVWWLCRITAILLIPLAAEMVFERIAAFNLFSAFGSIPEIPAIREGKIRAQGPFAHSILAGTVGAVSLPLMIGLLRTDRMLAIAGIGACLTMLATCGSSGPIMSALMAVGATCIWKWREYMRLLRWIAVFSYIALELVMKAPAYYIIARIKPLGASTGYYRAKLIQSAIENLDEWWLAGTDYTRHWMVTGVPWSPDHADITNHYIKMGVIGGLPLMILFVLTIAKSFSYIGQIRQKISEKNFVSQFFIWTIGASLLAHVVACVGVTYFDQSFIFIYTTMAAVGSLWSASNEIDKVLNKPQ